MAKLTDKAIAGLTVPPNKAEAWLSDDDVKGLRLRATTGAKTFYACWTDRATGARQREKLGAWGALTIEQARTAARIVMGKVAAGGDPAADREARAAAAAAKREEAARASREAAFTLDTLLTDWSTLHLSARRPRYAAEATRALRLAFKTHLDQPAAALDHAAALDVLDRLASAGKATTARLTLAYGRACYGWAVKRRRLPLNPFAGLPMPEGGAARERVLSATEIGEVWRAAGTMAAPHGPMVRFLLLTAARRDEAAGATWGEIAPDLSAWVQPAARTKNGRAHVVHMAEPARAILRDLLDAKPRTKPVLPPPERYLFAAAGNKPVVSHSWVKRTLDAAILVVRQKQAEEAGREAEPVPAWVLHDFRRSAVTWLAGAGFAPHVADRLLNHVTGTISGVAAVYQKAEFLEERKRALDAWAAHVAACAEGKADTPRGGAVVPFAEQRARRGRA